MTPHDAPPAPAPAARWIAVAILLAANFMNLLDVTIVNVALPSMERELEAGSNALEWIVAGYTFPFALLLLPSGRLGDIFGRKRMFLWGVGVFTCASALCGLAPGLEWLIAARVLQGAGGAMMAPQTLALVPALFAAHERGSAFSLFAFASSLAAVSGPVLGGFLVGADILGLGWRPIFLVNVPVGLLAVVLGLRYVPALPGTRSLGIDWAGIALAGLALFFVLMPLVEAPALGWRGWMTAMVAAAPVLAWVFVRWERRQERLGRPQLLPMRFLRDPGFRLGVVLSALLFSAVPGAMMLVALTLQAGMGLTPLQSGLTTVPFSFGVMASTPVARRLGARFLPARIAVGAVCIAGGHLGVALALAAMGDAPRWAATAPFFVLAGLGLGTAVSPLFQVSLAGAQGSDAGSASGAVQSLQQLGVSFGVAIMGGLFFRALDGAARGEAEVYARAAGLGLSYGIGAALAIALCAVVFRPGGGLREPPRGPIS